MQTLAGAGCPSTAGCCSRPTWPGRAISTDELADMVVEGSQPQPAWRSWPAASVRHPDSSGSRSPFADGAHPQERNDAPGHAIYSKLVRRVPLPAAPGAGWGAEHRCQNREWQICPRWRLCDRA